MAYKSGPGFVRGACFCRSWRAARSGRHLLFFGGGGGLTALIGRFEPSAFGGLSFFGLVPLKPRLSSIPLPVGLLAMTTYSPSSEVAEAAPVGASPLWVSAVACNHFSLVAPHTSYLALALAAVACPALRTSFLWGWWR